MSPLAVQGNVAYPIDKRSLGTLTDGQEAVLELCTEIDFPMGDIQVPLSREAISYTQRTTAIIKAKLDEVAATLPTLYQNEMDACTTGYEASKRMAEITKPMGYHVKGLITKSLHWNGLKVPDYIKVSKFTHPMVTQYLCDPHELRRRIRVNLVSQVGSELVFHPGHEIIVWWDKKIKSIRPYVDHYWKQQCMKEGKTLNIIACDDAAQFDALCKAVGDPSDVINVNNLPEPPKGQTIAATNTVSRAPVAKVFVNKGNGFNETSLPGDHGGEYVALDRGEAQGIPADAYFGSFLRAAQGWRERKCEVYGIPGTHKNLPKRYPDKWIGFAGALHKELEAFVDDKANAKLLSLLKFNYDLLDNNPLVRAIRQALVSDPTLTATQFGVKKNSDFNKLVENIRPYVAWDKWESLISLVNSFRNNEPHLEIKVLPGTIDLDGLFKDLTEKHPLIPHVFTRQASFSGDSAVEVFKDVATYIAKM
jgi:hypothetical protein